MSTNVKKMKTESKFERPNPLDPGTYPARTVGIVSLGLQAQRPYKGEDKPPKQEIFITYEAADEFLLDEDGNDDTTKPRWLNESLPLNSLDSDLANSTKRYYALDPNVEKDGEFLALIDTPCLITIVNNENKGVVYNNIASVQSMRAKDVAKAPPLVNKPVVFDFYNPDLEVFLGLRNFLQEKIKESLDYPGSDLEKLVDGGATPKKEEKKGKPVDKTPEEEDNNSEDW